jgi:hypothetical protein
MKTIKKIWNLILNNKRNISIGMLLINQGLNVFFPHLMTTEQFNWINGIGLTIGGTGLAHVGVNNAIKKAIKNKEK